MGVARSVARAVRENVPHSPNPGELARMHSSIGPQKWARQTDQRASSPRKLPDPDASDAWRTNGPISFATPSLGAVSKWTKPDLPSSSGRYPPHVTPSTSLASSKWARSAAETPASRQDGFSSAGPSLEAPLKWKLSGVEVVADLKPAEKLSHYEVRLRERRSTAQNLDVSPQSTIPPREDLFLQGHSEAPHMLKPRFNKLEREKMKLEKLRKEEMETMMYGDEKDDEMSGGDDPLDALDVSEESLFHPDIEADLDTRERRFGKKAKGVGNLLDALKAEKEQQGFRKRKIEEQTRLQRASNQVQRKPKIIKARNSKNDVYIPNNISVANLTRLLGVRHRQLQRKMQNIGMTNTDSSYMLSSDDVYLLALEFHRNPVIDDVAAFDLYPEPTPSDTSSLPLRPPVITIMGHVDHGKTTLLDTLRSASVASGEAGGITQHIGAFSVPVPSLSTSSASSPGLADGIPRTITFLDTPGHAAFTAMRARGAGVTDIIVLVVAADDGVMPQTREVIALSKKDSSSEDDYGVGMVVAVNKVDKPDADVTSVKHALLAEGVQLEEFGGDVPCVEVSGLTGFGLDKLVDTLSTLAEVKELRARRTGRAEGRVLESRVDKGRGPVATILVTQGCLETGSYVVAGTTWARVRQMTDSSGVLVRSATPGFPVTLSGWKELPQAGDEVLEGGEDDVKKAIQNRKRNLALRALQEDVTLINEKRMEAKEIARETGTPGLGTTGEGFLDTSTVTEPPPVEDNTKELRLIIKGDVSGSVEAVVGAVEGIGNNIAKVRIIQATVGEPTEADVDMAKAVNATIIGFSVNANHKVKNHAASFGVPMHTDTVIYRIMDEVRSRVQALLPVIIEHRVCGEALVQQLFEVRGKHNANVRVAGCRVTNGVIERHNPVKVLRNDVEVYNGTLDALRHIKKDILEARKGNECGMSFVDFVDVQEGDRIQSFEVIEKPGEL